MGNFHSKLKSIDYKRSKIIFTDGAFYDFDFLRENPLIPQKKEVKHTKWQDQEPWCNFEFCKIDTRNEPLTGKPNTPIFKYNDIKHYLFEAMKYDNHEGFSSEKPTMFYSTHILSRSIKNEEIMKMEYVVFKKEQ
jgi:hypothetical protein